MASPTGRINLPFAGGFYPARNKQFSNQRCVNWYPSFAQSDALNEYCLVNTPGIRELFPAAPIGGPGRGSFVMNNVPYFVCGNTLFRINRSLDVYGRETLSREALGEIPGTGYVRMASNKTELCIVVPGQYAYIYDSSEPDPTLALQPITSASFDGPVDDVIQIDSVFIFNKTGTNKIFHSDLNQGKVYNALDFTFVNQCSVVVGLASIQNQLFAMGDRVTVPYTNVGGAQFLFQAMPSSAISSGLLVASAKSQARGSVFYLGGGQNEEVAVWMCSGGAPTKISTDAIDYFLQNFTPDELSRAAIWSMAHSGADFVIITVAESTIAYDITASRFFGKPVWHERSSRIKRGVDFIDYAWRANGFAQAYNRTLLCDAVDSRIGVLDDDLFTEYGERVHRVFISQPFINQGVASRVNEIELYLGQNTPKEIMNPDVVEDNSVFSLTSLPYEPSGNHEEIRNQKFEPSGGRNTNWVFYLNSEIYTNFWVEQAIADQQFIPDGGEIRRIRSYITINDEQDVIENQSFIATGGQLTYNGPAQVKLEVFDEENSIEGQELEPDGGEIRRIIARFVAGPDSIQSQAFVPTSIHMSKVVVNLPVEDDQDAIQGQGLVINAIRLQGVTR